MSAGWTDWVGRTRNAADRVDAARVARFCATLDRDVPDTLAPQALHWCLCLPDSPTAWLGPDGHPARGRDGLLPPIDLPRRMWAASTVRFHAPLAIGDDITRTSRIAAITPKTGASGALVFVELEHETRAQGGHLLVSETQTLVYREPAGAAAGAPRAEAAGFDPAAWDRARSLTPDPVLLMRYSALTFNSHRIHYDWPYATHVEGYRGLVVHGPLIASLLLDLAAQHCGDNRLTRFAFRAVAPAIAGEALWLALRHSNRVLTLGAFAADGRTLVQASAEL